MRKTADAIQLAKDRNERIRKMLNPLVLDICKLGETDIRFGSTVASL